jgi:hypothetical protein
MTKSRPVLFTVAAALLACAVSTTAHAEEEQLFPGVAFEPSTALESAVPETTTEGEVEEPRRWRMAATLYAWVPSFRGDVAIKGNEGEAALSRSDIWNNLDIALMGRFEMGRIDSDWSFWTDIFWAKLEDDGGADFEFGPRGKGRADLAADFDVRMSFVELGAAYHWYRSEEQVERTYREPSRTGVDMLMGARYARMRLKADLEANVSAPFGSFSKGGKTDDKETWIDPFVGARVHHALAPDVWLIVRGDVGGFGVGADLAWTTTATFQYFVSDQVAFGAGWKIMDLDYDDGGFEADVRMSGPFVTLTFAF